MEASGRWARLAINTRTPLRRGAWYVVHSVSPEEVVLDIRGKSTIVPRYLLDLTDEAPNRWTAIPASWGGPYIVCPNCAMRVRPRDTASRLHCPTCSRWFVIEGDS